MREKHESWYKKLVIHKIYNPGIGGQAMIHYGLIGCGAAAKVHLHHLQQHPEVKIIAVCDPAPALEFTALDVPRYSDYREMLAKEQLDAVTIASPHYLHYKQIMACAQKGINVLCEKPLALTFSQAVAAVAECKKKEVKLAVMLQRRYFHNTAALEKIVESKALGEIKKVQYHLQVNKKREYYQGWRGKKEFVGGGVLLCQGLHDLDRIIHCFGQPRVISSQIKTTRDYIDVEDEAQAVLQLPKNILWNITASANAPTLWSGKISVEGDKGSLVLDSEKVLEWNVPKVPLPMINTKPDRTFVPAYYDPGHEEIIEDFIQSILHHREPKVNGESSLPALQTLFEIYDLSKL